jgi:hypothetical protein
MQRPLATGTAIPAIDWIFFKSGALQRRPLSASELEGCRKWKPHNTSSKLLRISPLFLRPALGVIDSKIAVVRLRCYIAVVKFSVGSENGRLI